jgi:hypothetical protein
VCTWLLASFFVWWLALRVSQLFLDRRRLLTIGFPVFILAVAMSLSVGTMLKCPMLGWSDVFSRDTHAPKPATGVACDCHLDVPSPNVTRVLWQRN